MSEIVTDEMRERAAKAIAALYEDTCTSEFPTCKDGGVDGGGCACRDAARAALSAVAPDIAAEAVERCASLGWLTPAKVAEIEAAEREPSIAAISKRRDESISEDMTEVDVAYEAGLHDAINIIRARKG